MMILDIAERLQAWSALTAQLQNYTQLADGWCGEQTKAPTREQIATILPFLSCLPQELALPTISVGDGTLHLTWTYAQGRYTVEAQVDANLRLHSKLCEPDLFGRSFLIMAPTDHDQLAFIRFVRLLQITCSTKTSVPV